MKGNPARALLEHAASAENAGAVRTVMDRSPLPLDANFYEKLLWQVDAWQRSGDPIADTGQRAFERLWEHRYRRVDVNHWVTAEARAFLEQMLAHRDPSAIKQFAQTRINEFSPNVVEALLSADVLFDIPEKELRSAANEMAAVAAQGLGMRLMHLPPKTWRDTFVWEFVDLYRTRQLMRAVGATAPVLLEQIGFTIAGILDALKQSERLPVDERIATFVNFMEALALHLAERQPAENDPSHKVAAYLYEQLIILYEECDLQEEFASAVANQGRLQLVGQAT